MSDQPTWKRKVNNFKESNGFDLDFDLAKDFQKLPLRHQRKESIRDALKEMIEEKEAAYLLIQQAISNLLLASTYLQKVNPIIQEIINVDKKVSDLETMIKECQEINNWTIHSTNYSYSLPKMYISQLCGIFYKGTGVMPICKPKSIKTQDNNDDCSIYTGNFYIFLIGAKPLLLEIGIDLGNNDETIGRNAYEFLKGSKKKEILSFKELLLEEAEIEKIRLELL